MCNVPSAKSHEPLANKEGDYGRYYNGKHQKYSPYRT